MVVSNSNNSNSKAVHIKLLTHNQKLDFQEKKLMSRIVVLSNLRK